MKLFEQLGFVEGFDTGSVQSVDEMTMIPLIRTKDLTDKVSEPGDLEFEGTNQGYGNMTFRNRSRNRPAIVPSNTMVLSRELAQDHAMSDSALVPANQAITFNNACCVEQTQGGYLKDKEKFEFNVLPLDLRLACFKPSLRNQESYDKLWRDIESFTRDIPQVGATAHITRYFKPYAKELETFVAEFEPVENQIGALIYYGAKLVGVEIMPTRGHWETYWKWLVRGCYGAQLLKLRLQGQAFRSVGLPGFNADDPHAGVRDYLTFLDGFKKSLLSSLPALGSATQRKAVDQDFEFSVVALGDRGKADVLRIEQKPVYVSGVLR